MLSARLISFFLFFVTFGLVAASPTPETGLVAKRADVADVLTVLNTLKGSTDEILPEITSVLTSGKASDATITPLFNELTAALDTATASFAALEPSARRALSSRQSDDEVANLVATIVTDITTTLDGLLVSAITIPALGGLLAGVDTSLNQVIKGLEILLAGVLTLVANLLVNVAALLKSLAFGLTLASLGL